MPGAEARSVRGQAQELHHARHVPLHHAGRSSLRHRRLRSHARQGDGNRRRRRFREAPRREREAGQAQGHGPVDLDRGLRHRALAPRRRPRQPRRPL